MQNMWEHLKAAWNGRTQQMLHIPGAGPPSAAAAWTTGAGGARTATSRGAGGAGAAT